MASNSIKGLTVEIGGDTTKLGKALEDVNKKSSNLSSELGQINRLLKLDPKNTELLAQKQKVLADAVTNTSSKLDILKEAERQVQVQFQKGEASEAQVRALQREIIATTSKLDAYKKAAADTADSLDDMGRESKEAADEADDLQSGLANAASKGFAVFTGAIAAAVAGLVGIAETTRDYRMEMGKLDTAFSDNGFSAEAAKSAYTDLVGILGETDQSVEAANHLAKLTDNEKDLAAWTGDILPGVFATFGDSLPIEGLTEAANETAKVGEVTGPLADALNWAGESEDDFNEKLAKCTSEQERQALITKTLTDLYGDASSAYKETNKDVIAANQANDAMTNSLAKVGATVEPVLTKVKEMAAALIEKMVPVIQAILDNLPTVGIVLAGVTAAIIAFKVASIAATAATKGMTLAQYAAATAQKILNAVMNANPIGLVILAITALVAAFVTLWKNSEAFRQFWIGLWEGIKTAFSAVVDFLKNAAASIAGFFTGAWEKIKAAWNAVTGFFSNIWTGIKNVFSAVGNWFKERFTKAYQNAQAAWAGAKKFFAGIWSGIQTIFSNIANWFKDRFTKAYQNAKNAWAGAKAFFTGVWNGIKGIFSGIANWFKDRFTKAYQNAKNAWAGAKNFFSGVWNGIKGVFSGIGSWFKDRFATAYKNVTNAWSGVKSFFSGIWSKIKSAFKFSDMLSIGKNIISGLWEGISSKIQWLKDKITGFASGVLNKIKGVFGIHSPSKEMAWVGDMLDQGLAEGMLDNANDPIRAMQRVSAGVLDAANNGVDGLTLERQLRRPAMVTPAAAPADGGILAKLDEVLAAIKSGQVLTIDGTALVGATADRYDATLGQRRALAARGAV